MRSTCLGAIATMLAMLQGCATQLDLQALSSVHETHAVPSSRALLFQNTSIMPRNAALLAAEDLQQGDIILTSAPTIASAGIQLFTLAPVSHAAIYVGNGKVVEAVRPEVRTRSLEDLMAQETVALALRYPDLTPAQAQTIAEYAREKTGTSFNYLSVTLHVPFSIKRKVCELPLVPSALRDACIRALGVMHYVGAEEQQLFCSQLVSQAYRRAGVPLADADPRLISPADLLHMREGDVPSLRIHRPLRYVGHLKYQPAAIAVLE